jgi:hypothetical protein
MEKSKKLDFTTRKSYRISKTPSWFLKLPPYNRNREVEVRIPRIVNLLSEEPLPTHLEVAVGYATKSFGPYKKGDYFRLNGNTRCECWSIKPDLIPNCPLDVKVYEVDSAEYTYKIYDSIDSQQSVETSNDKSTGLLRERNYKAVSTVVKKGKFITAVKNAAQYTQNEEGTYLGGKNVRKNFNILLDHFWEELKFIDGFNLDRMDKKYSGNILTALLLISKKYGTKNKKIKVLVQNYIDSESVVNTPTERDGVNYVFNTVFSEYHTNWKATGFSNARIVIAKILYGFDSFMRDENIHKKVKIKDKVLLEYYQNYLD